MSAPTRELLFYSEKVGSDEIRALFVNLTKRSVPLLGFLDLSLIFSSIPSPIIIKRDGGTLRFFVRENRAMQQLANLLFPFKMGEQKEVQRASAGLLPLPKIYVTGGENMLDMLIKEDIVDMSFYVRRVLGKFVGTIRAVDASGAAHYALITDPEKFFQINLEKHPSVYIELLEPMPKSIAVSSVAPIFLDGATHIGVDSYDPIQHTLMVGESGCGKTKALIMMIKSLEQKYGDNLRLIVLDPHGEFQKSMPEYPLVDFKRNYVEPLDVGGDKTPLMTQLVSQLISSTIGEDNKYSARILFYSTYLLSSVDKLTLQDISKLLTDSAYRMEISSKSNVDEAKRFFDQEYQDIYMHHFNDAVLPILNFIGEYELYLGKEMQKETLSALHQRNRVTLISFDPNFFGKTMIKFLAGAIINQMYILAITGKIKTPTILVVDEFPRVETLVVKDILAETRKYNLHICLSMQYLGQLRKEILDAIISNTKNIISFKTNRGDATLVSSIMDIKLEEYFKKSRTTTEIEESKKEMFVRLNQRECVVRLYDGKKYMIPMKVKTVDVGTWLSQAKPSLREKRERMVVSAPATTAKTTASQPISISEEEMKLAYGVLPQKSQVNAEAEGESEAAPQETSTSEPEQTVSENTAGSSEEKEAAGETAVAQELSSGIEFFSSKAASEEKAGEPELKVDINITDEPEEKPAKKKPAARALKNKKEKKKRN